MQLPRKEYYECKTCGRRFESFQALGGHRASHSKPKLSGDEGIKMAVAKVRVHECSLCGLEFATGQALGGHMRRHRGVLAAQGLMEKKSSTSTMMTTTSGERVLLDLNFPPLEEDGKLGLGLSLGLVSW